MQQAAGTGYSQVKPLEKCDVRNKPKGATEKVVCYDGILSGIHLLSGKYPVSPPGNTSKNFFRGFTR